MVHVVGVPAEWIRQVREGVSDDALTVGVGRLSQIWISWNVNVAGWINWVVVVVVNDAASSSSRTMRRRRRVV